jgi:hypothetical protein
MTAPSAAAMSNCSRGGMGSNEDRDDRERGNDDGHPPTPTATVSLQAQQQGTTQQLMARDDGTGTMMNGG